MHHHIYRWQGKRYRPVLTGAFVAILAGLATYGAMLANDTGSQLRDWKKEYSGGK